MYGSTALREERLVGCNRIPFAPIAALKELADPATATLILRLGLRRARAAAEHVTAEATLEHCISD